MATLVLKYSRFKSRTFRIAQTRIGRPSIVAVDALAALVALLRFEAQGGHRPRVEALHANRLACFLAITVGAVLDALQSRIDLRDQLPLAVAGAKFNSAIGLVARPVSDVGVLS